MKLFFDENEFQDLLKNLTIEKTVSGGSVANTIVGLSQLGNKVGFVGKISDERYEQDVKLVSLFLNGKSTKLLNEISKKMKAASSELDFEAAATYRDQLINLRTIQERHSSQFTSDMDVLSVVKDSQIHCIEIVFVRSGKQIGSETFFPKNAKNDSCESVLSAFLPLYYLGKNTPKEIVISHKLKDKSLLEKGLSQLKKLLRNQFLDSSCFQK